MEGHKCKPLAVATNLAPGREIWLGELTESIEGYLNETHCLHITTPEKSVVFGINLGDALIFAVFAQILHEGPINQHWLNRLEQAYRFKARTVEDE